MALTLDDIQRGKQFKPPRMILYGVAGIGKSTFGADMPNPIFIQTEDGLDNIDTNSFKQATSIQEVGEAIDALLKEKHKFETVVLDSLDWLEQLIWKHVAAEGEEDHIEDFGYGKGYVIALDSWRYLLGQFTRLRNERNMAILLIGHSEIKRFDGPEVESYDRYQIKLHKRAEGLVTEWADAVFFCNYKMVTQKSDVGFGKEITRGQSIKDSLGSGLRSIFTEETPAFIAKNHYDLPVEIEMPKEHPAAPLMDAIRQSFTPDLKEAKGA